MAPAGRLTPAAGGPPQPNRPPRRRWWALALLLLVPLLEILVIVAVSQAIGGWWTFGLLLAFTLAGAALVRREGSRTWSALRAAVTSGRMPGRELADAVLVMVGGLLMLTPGFVTDAVGAFLVLPFSRSVSRRLLATAIGSRILGGAMTGAQQWPPPPGAAGHRPGGRPGAGRRAGADDDIIEGEIVRDDPPPPQH